MNYKITISRSQYPHNETETVTVTAEQLISALINEFDYDIYVDGINATICGDTFELHSADAEIDGLEASMFDAVVSGLDSLLRYETEKQN